MIFRFNGGDFQFPCSFFRGVCRGFIFWIINFATQLYFRDYFIYIYHEIRRFLSLNNQYFNGKQGCFHHRLQRLRSVENPDRIRSIEIPGWLIGIPIMVYEITFINPYITGQYNPTYIPSTTQPGVFFSWPQCDIKKTVFSPDIFGWKA